jgi:aryl-alcohol dehydrogenase-like predicted oxidoreductase
MRSRTYQRTGWPISEIGYGMWGLGDWTGSDDAETAASLEEAVRLGCTFFDTAWAYGAGHSERLLAALNKKHSNGGLRLATKVPPKNERWIQLDGFALDEVFPPDHVRAFTERSLKNLGVDAIDVQQFHAWSDRWANEDRLLRTLEDLKREGKVRSWGISVNRWEPTNVLKALATGLIDSVQVVYNIFDQAPEDELFPYCQQHGIAIIARVPFDEGSLTGTLTPSTRWPEGDWRNLYFPPAHLAEALEHVERLKPLVPPGMTLPELALRFILHHPAVTTVIPGMRKIANVRANCGVSDGRPLATELVDALRAHRWERDWVVP